jgi:hypothetical protein
VTDNIKYRITKKKGEEAISLEIGETVITFKDHEEATLFANNLLRAAEKSQNTEENND